MTAERGEVKCRERKASYMPRIQANQRSFFYDEAGSGPPIVFLSGLGGDHRAFSIALKAFSKTHRAIAIDNRDVGQSDRATAPYGIVDLADDTAAILAAIDVENAHIVGQSLGGLIAQELTLGHPSLVRSLVLASTHGGVNPWRRAVIESWIVMKHRTSAREFAECTLPWLVSPRYFKNPAQIEGLARFAERNDYPQDAAAFSRQAHAAFSHETRSRLHTIFAPTLVLVGADDLVNPPAIAKELADLIPGAILNVMPGVGHLPHIEDGAAFREAIAEWLNRHL